MKSITIHALDDDVFEGIKKKAQQDGDSLNKTIKKLLREALGLASEQIRIRREAFEDLFGCWSFEDAVEFEAVTQDFDCIDPEDWKS
jgi:plasmid stability protein